MSPRDDLREKPGFGAIGFVADNAEFGRIRQDGFLAGEILSMAGQWPVAGFAPDIGMRALVLRHDDLIVAGRASLAPAENRGARRDFLHGGRPKVTVLAEVGRYQEMANDEEGHQCEKRDDSQPNQVLRAFEELPHRVSWGSKRRAIPDGSMRLSFCQPPGAQ